MKKYNVTGTVTGGKWLGVYEAESPEAAIEMALDAQGGPISLCHNCADECCDGAVEEAAAEEGMSATKGETHSRLGDNTHRTDCGTHWTNCGRWSKGQPGIKVVPAGTETCGNCIRARLTRERQEAGRR